MFLRNLSRQSDAVELLQRSGIMRYEDRQGETVDEMKFDGGQTAIEQIQSETDRLLSPSQKAVADWMMEQFNTADWKGMLNRASLLVEGVERFNDPAYWPLYIYRGRSPMVGGTEALAGMLDENGALNTKLSWGGTKGRVRHHQPLMILDAEDAFFAQAKDASRYAYQFAPAITALGVLSHVSGEGNVAGMIMHRLGKDKLAFMRDTLVETAGRAEHNYEGFKRFFNQIMSNAAVAILWGRITSILNNRLGSSVLMMSELAHRHGAKAAGRYLAQIDLPGPLFWARQENRDIGDRLMLNGFLGNRWSAEGFMASAASVRPGDLGHSLDVAGARWRKVQELGMRPMQLAEMKNAIIAFKVLRALGLTDAQAVAEVERLTRNTQNTSSRLDESVLLRKIKDSPGMSLVAPFFSQVAIGGRLLQRDILALFGAEDGRDKAHAAKNLAYSVMGLTASATIAFLLYSLVRAAQKGDKWPPEDETEQMRQLAFLGGNVLDSVMPGLGMAAEVVNSFFGSGLSRDNSLFGRAADKIKSGYHRLNAADSISFDDPKAVAGLDALLEGLAQFAGVPYSGPMQSVKAVAGLAGRPLVAMPSGSSSSGQGGVVRRGSLPPRYVRPMPPPRRMMPPRRNIAAE